MTIIYPEATPVQGNTSLVLITTVVNRAAVSLATEINAASSVNVSCFVRDWNPEMTSNSGSAPARLCSRVQLPVEGNTQFAPIEVRYVYNPQEADTTNNNKAKSYLAQGVLFNALVRKGFDAQTSAMAAGQRYELWRFRAGRQNKVRSGTDEFSEFEISQMWFPLIEPVDGVIAA